MRRLVTLTSAATALIALHTTALAQVPSVMPLQGRLDDNAGAPVGSGAFACTFSLYRAQSGGAAVWTESWPPDHHDCATDPSGCVIVSGGVFAIELGSHNPLSAATFDAVDRWLGVSVEGEPELPRRHLGTSAYAYRASVAGALDCSGCVAADQLAAGAAVRSLNGLTGALTLAAGDGISLDNSGGTLTITNTRTGALSLAAGEGISLDDSGGTLTITNTAPGGGGDGGGGVVKVVDASNYTSIEIAPNDLVKIDATITLSADYGRLDHEALHIHGGGFVGSGSEEIELGRHTVVSGVSFEDVHLDGMDILFENCTFRGAINFPFGATLVRPTLSGVVQSTIHRLGAVIGADIDNSTLLRVDSVTDSEIADSTLGGTGLNFNTVGRITNSRIRDSVIYVRSGVRFTGNDVDSSHVQIVPEARGAMLIANNHFDDLYAGASEVILFDMSDSAWYTVLITGNTFIVQSGDPQAIRVAGSPEGAWQYQLVQISNNNFLKGDRAIAYTGDNRVLVRGNMIRATSLGVSAGGNLQVGDNYTF